MNAPGPRLELRQGQSLVMTAQLQQSIKLLQLSSLELNEFLEQELEKNPLLSMEEGDDSQGEAGEAGEPVAGEAESAATAESPNAENTNEERSLDMPDESTGEYEAGPELGYSGSSDNRQGGEDADGGFEQSLSEKITLREHLTAQLVEIEHAAERMIATHLIDMVDEAGYIKDDLEALTAQLGCPSDAVETVLHKLQAFDPPGVCARTLSECLGLQLGEKDRLDPVMKLFLDHLDLIGKGDFAALQKICGVDQEDIRDMLKEIRALNPKPGNLFPGETLQPVIPDVILRKGKQNQWQVELNPDALPRVLINRRYYSELSDQSRTKQERKYLTEQLATASWLTKALDQRAQTILKVSTEIVAQQDAFFRHGVRHLKPLTLKDIANPVALHESTVSRVTSNKYMLTPRGTFRLKDFFTSSLQSATGVDVSSRSVQHMIKELIDAEKTNAILSDDMIAEMLQNRGIDVARRTVAKYREEMRIPSSVQRRRDKTRQCL